MTEAWGDVNPRERDVWCLLFVLIRHGEEGATSLHAGLERLGKETGEPTGTQDGSHPLRTLTSVERSLGRFKFINPKPFFVIQTFT